MLKNVTGDGPELDPNPENEMKKTPFDGNLSFLFVSIRSGRIF